MRSPRDRLRPASSIRQRVRYSNRIASQGGRNQVIETFHELSAGERLRNEGGGREAVQFLKGN